MADEVLTGWGRTGKWLCMEHWGVVPDVVSIGKGFGNGFPVTCVAVRDPYKESFEKISASSSYGGNPMACAAALASTEVIEEENCSTRPAPRRTAQKRMEQMKAEHPIVGDVARRVPHGDRAGQGPGDKKAVRQGGRIGLPEGVRKGLAWIPAGHILRMSPPIVMDDDTLLEGLDIIDEAIGETEKELGYLTIMKRIRFGIIGCGLMGREFASAAARWCHLLDMDVRPEIVAVCDANPDLLPWYTENFPSIQQATRTIANCSTIPRSRRCIAPCRTTCTAKFTVRRSRPEST